MNIENPKQIIPEEEAKDIQPLIDSNVSLYSILDQIKEADEETLRKIHEKIESKVLFPIIKNEILKEHIVAKRAAIKKRASELGIDLCPDTVKPY